MWVCFTDEDFRFIRCTAHEGVATAILRELGQNIRDKITITEGTFDLPGIMVLDRHCMEYELDGFTVKIPATDVHRLHAYWVEAKVQRLGDVEFYRLPAYMASICVTPEQRDRLVCSISESLPEALAIANLENHRWNKRWADNPNSRVLMAPRLVTEDVHEC